MPLDNNHTPKQVAEATLISFRDVSLSFGSHKVLHNINLTLRKGDKYFVTGDSGVGKTTLLQLLALSTKPSSGVIAISKTPFFISTIRQNRNLLSELSLLENINLTYDSYFHGSCRDFESQRNSYLEELGVSEDLLRRKSTKVNEGLKQITEWVQVFLSQADLIIADEPTSALDQSISQKIFSILNRQNHERKTSFIWATHERRMIQHFSGKLIHLSEGRISYQGEICLV